jgi:chemotaxis protein CheY-P-specific phosphatase CheC
MPISNEEVRNYQINSILSSTKEELNQLMDIELTSISDILRYRKQNPPPLFTIQSLLKVVHFLIGEEESKISNKEVIPKKEKKQVVKGKPILKIVK